jgi:hypothetical protein
MNIPIGVIGEILNLGEVGHKVKVLDDTENTGGFLIYEWWDHSSGPNVENAFDAWVENQEMLNHFFKESGWHILWQA